MLNLLQSKQVKKISPTEKKIYAISTGSDGLRPPRKHIAHAESFINGYKANEKQYYSISMD